MIEITLWQISKIYLIGALYDFIAATYLVIPFVLYLLVIPHKLFNHKIHQIIISIFVYILLFGVVFYAFSEWFFWDEFSVRFNFIAVDYLVYTTEVIGNIKESYPMGILLSVIAIISAVLWYIIYKFDYISDMLKDERGFKERLKPALLYLMLPLLFWFGVNQEYTKISKNQYNNELSKAGLYSLFAAFINNTLDYNSFYITQKEEDLSKNLKKLLDINASLSLNEKGITHSIIKSGKEQNYNIMMIVVESLSGRFLESLGGNQALTPNLDALSQKSLFFDNFYATGTRTVRGMESIVLSLPPTAGRSIVKRPDNHNMYSSGFIFQEKGYDTKFIYGGHGYFDNMNEFFSHNGFDVVDRTDFSDEEDNFHTVWGVCDEDLLDKTLKESDASFKEHKPFMNFVMTTSNHRPYDYPEGRIDIPSHTGREGAVKYTDYAIGEFLKKAEKKPWFKNTIFVIVADHCASSAGKTELPIDKYHIPLIVYAPGIIAAKKIEKVSSQIDIMPTLFSLLNWSYKSKFYGKDILSDSFKERALVGTYQKLGLYQNNILTLLSPGKKIDSYEVLNQDIFHTEYKDIATSSRMQEKIVSYYQGASMLHKKRLDRYTLKGNL